MDLSYVDHGFYRLDEDTRAALEAVAQLKHDLALAGDAGRDLRSVMHVLQPGLTHSMVESMKDGDGQIQARLRDARTALRSAQAIPGHRRIGSRRIAASQWAARPSLASRDECVVVAWIEWEHSHGEKVVAAVFEGDDVAHAATVVSAGHADCHRPTATFDTDGRPWVFFGRSNGGSAAVWATFLEGSQWTAPERVSPSHHVAFNQEVTVDEHGAIECCWQQESGGRFAIVARTWTEGHWGEVTRISESGSNAWDPTIASLADGSTAYAWSRYDSGSYQVMVRRRSGSVLGPERQLTSGTDYALHPSLAATSDGHLWCAFDILTVQGHGGSGPTRLRPAERLGLDFPESGVVEPRNHDPDMLVPDLGAEMRVIRIDDDGIADTGQVGECLDISPAGLPRLTAAGSSLVVAYRTLRRMPIVSYYWEVGAQQLGPDGWSDPMTFADSDAGLEEASVAWSAGELHVAWQCDGRRDRNIAWLGGPTGGSEVAFLREHYGEAIWHSTHSTGSIRMARVPARDAGRAATVASTDVVTCVRRVEARPWPRDDRQRYTTQAGGKRLTLYWGDLHRHSLISRCTAGDEPSLADYYRYALDLCEYDFWAVTDHAEHSSPYQWWQTQKIADLFLIDDEFVPLYGFEWTGESGHQNVIFGDVPRGAPIFSSRASGSQTPSQLWEHLRARPTYPAITIPHHPGAATIEYDWEYYDPDYLRLVEVFQACRGNYEHNGCFRQFADATVDGTFVVDGLRRGHRFGLIASSDHGYGSSYVGVLAESLDRRSIFEALRSRRVLGATSRDIVADMRVGEALMGQEIVSAGPVTLDITVRGYRDIARIDVVRNGDVAHSILPDLSLPPGWAAVPLRVEWVAAMAGRDCSGDLRVDDDAEIVQTPFWSPHVSTAGRKRITWEARSTPSAALYGRERGGVECTVVGRPHASITVRTPWATLEASLDHLRRGRILQADDGSGGHVRVQLGTGGLSSLGVDDLSLRWTDDHRPDGAWYYVRAFLVDGEMAWASPIWVDPP